MSMNWNKGGPSGKRGFGFGGFAISTGKKEEPKLPQTSHSAFKGPPSAFGSGTSQLPSFYKIGSKRANFDEENAYFDDEEEDSNNMDLPYIPAENSPTRQQMLAKKTESDSEEDPLEAFMAEVEDQAARDLKKLEEKDKEKKNARGIRDDIEEEDDQEAYFRYMAENPTAGLIPEEEEDNLEYDSDGNPIASTTKRIIDPLPPVDHTEIEYHPFEKNFYEEHEEITALTPQQVVELQHKLNLRVSGAAPPRPASSFAHFGFDEQLMHQIRKSEYTQPTPIQCQGIPVALSGRDLIGIAKTGSGKTAAFIWPILVHIMDQKELQPGDGPIAVIVCPTRELCQQIHSECKRFGKAYNLRSVAVYGGGSMWEQAKALQEGAEIVVCTPGRLIDHVKKKATNLQRVTYLVFDEADRMFDMGFEYQVRSIANHVRPDRQTLLFSATFRKKIERLARDILIDPIRIVQGDIGEANEDITQVVDIFPSGPEKWAWVTRRLVEFTSAGSVLVFVTKKANAEELANNLRVEDHPVGLLHGDMDQSERNKVITDFKKKAIPVMVATDVAARGLDIPSIKTVINYDVARDIDTHTHRIGRTGRAGEKGVAYTLLTPKDSNFAGDLVRNLEGANQFVSKDLLDLAMQNAWFRKSRFKSGKGKKLNVGGGGLGYRERPGLGADHSERAAGGVMSNYEAFKPTGGAMGDRLSAMKAAFQSQYKNHFVAASSSSQKTATSNLNSGAWTSAGSLNSVPTTPAPSVAKPEETALSSSKTMLGFTSSGTLSSIPAPQYPPMAPVSPSFSPTSQYSAKESNREGSGSRERDKHSDGRGKHGDGHRHGDRESHRHGDGHRHSGGGRHGDSRNGEGRREGDGRRETSRDVEGRREGSRDRDESRRDSYGDSRKESSHESRRESSRDGDSRKEPREEGESRRESSRDGDSRKEPREEGESRRESSRDGDSRKEPREEGESRRESSRDGDSRKEPREDGESRRESSRDGDSRKEPREDGESRKESKGESFAVPEPPKRKKSRWDT